MSTARPPLREGEYELGCIGGPYDGHRFAVPVESLIVDREVQVFESTYRLRVTLPNMLWTEEWWAVWPTLIENGGNW